MSAISASNSATFPPVERRLLHHALARDDVAYALLEVVLMNQLVRVAEGLAGRGEGRRQNRVPDIASAHLVHLGELAEIHIITSRFTYADLVGR